MPHTQPKEDVANMTRNADDFEYVTSHAEVNLARLVNELSGTYDFRSYFHRSGIRVV